MLKQYVVTIISMFLLSACVCAQENYSTWPNSQKVSINTTSDGANVTGTITNFPLLVRLNDGNFNFSQSTNGDNLRFANAHGTPLAYQIERWCTTCAPESAEIWVRIDTIAGNNSTQYVTMYWGKSGAPANSDGTAVFLNDDGYAGVWHLDEDRDGTGLMDVYLDATAAASNGIDYVNSTGKSGVVGRGQQFDKTQLDYIEIESIVAPTQGFTASAWVYSDTVIVDWDTSAAKEQVVLGNFKWLHTGNTGWEFGFLGTQVICAISNGGKAWNYCPGLLSNYGGAKKWTHFAVTRTNEDGTISFYKNGKKMADSVANSGDLDVSSDPLTISSPVENKGFDGFLDEVRQENVVRSADWIKLCYETQRTTQHTVQVGSSGVINPFFRSTRSNGLFPGLTNSDEIIVYSINGRQVQRLTVGDWQRQGTALPAGLTVLKVNKKTSMMGRTELILR